jgi:hypothetical protein
MEYNDNMWRAIMSFNKILVKTFPFFAVFLLFSCYSNPKSINGLIDYSDTNLPNMMYDIGIDIFDKDISILRHNIFNEIIKNNGKIMQETIENINSHRITVNIPKNNTADFIAKVRTFGIVVNENKRGNDIEQYYKDTEMRFINIKNMLETYEKLLKDSTNISDKLMLEEKINDAKMGIESRVRQKKEMEVRVENNTITILMYNK